MLCDEFASDSKLTNEKSRGALVYRPLEQPIKIEKSILENFERKEFAVIEWGTEVK